MKALPWILAFAIAVTLVETNISFKQEINDHKEAKHPQENQSLVSVPREGVLGVIAAAWHWLRVNSDPVIAGATLVIAFFTIKIFLDESANRKRELRAYVGVAEPKLIIKMEAGEPKLLVIMKYINAGQTPADHASLHMRAKAYKYFKRGHPKPAWEDPTNENDEGRGGVILPDVPWYRHSEVEGYTNTLIDELDGKHKTVWVWGTFNYEDIFGEWSTVKFRFSSSDYKRDFDVPEHGGPVKGYALIPDLEHTTAKYGKQA